MPKVYILVASCSPWGHDIRPIFLNREQQRGLFLTLPSTRFYYPEKKAAYICATGKDFNPLAGWGGGGVIVFKCCNEACVRFQACLPNLESCNKGPCSCVAPWNHCRVPSCLGSHIPQNRTRTLLLVLGQYTN